MSDFTLTPLRFQPIFQYRMWGGRRFENLFAEELPSGPIGEAWVLSDRDDFPSIVADGPKRGQSFHDLIESDPVGMLGDKGHKFKRYPLLMKFLDAREMLSVQVHPSDLKSEFLPQGEKGKTEAWVVLESDPSSQILAGLKPGATADDLRHLTKDNATDSISSFNPEVGDAIFLEAGTVHALGDGVEVFEVQQNSDVTFRLFDFDRVDAKTGKPRELHVEDAIACTDFQNGPVRPSVPLIESSETIQIEQLFDCEFFRVWRKSSEDQFSVGRIAECRAIVCLEGSGEIKHREISYPIHKGNVYFLPAIVGKCECISTGSLKVLEIALP